MRVNTTKAKLDAGEVVFGGIIGGFAPEMVEMLALIGFDFVFIDCEHGSMSFDQVENMVRAAEAYNVTPIARIPDQAETTILRFLDRGLQGIIVPHVNTRAQAESIATAARYYPEGHRGAASGRAHDYNLSAGREETSAFINQNMLVIPMCEETEAVKNLEEIIAVPGVDVFHAAAMDLTQSLGNPPPAEVRAVIKDVVQRTRAGGKHAGIGGNSPTDAAGIAELIAAGANFVTISAMGLFRVGAEQFRREVTSARKERGV